MVVETNVPNLRIMPQGLEASVYAKALDVSPHGQFKLP